LLRRLIVLAALLICLPGADWAHWRGPNRNDLSDESSGWTGAAWPAAKPAWTARVGEGGTSPIVVGGRLYSMGWKSGQNTVYCLDAVTGKERWKHSYKCPQYGRHAVGDQGLYSGCSATPEFDAKTGCLYTLSCDGDLHAWDTAKNGQQLWHINLYDLYGIGRRPQATARKGTLRDYGYTTAPLVWNDWVVVEVGRKDGNLMAFDRRTGKRVWASENRDPAGHTGGLVPLTVEGVPCVAVLTMNQLVVARLDAGQEGKTVAEFPWVTDFANNVATPAVEGQSVIITSGYNHYAMCRVDVTLKGARKVWEQPTPSGVCSPVIYKGHVYWAWRTLTCLDLETGAKKWSGPGFGDAGSCVITQDGRIIAWTKRGELVLAETADRSPKEYQELARVNVGAPNNVWPHVVLANGRLYCKDSSGTITCYRLSN
jgi:outer membrane protein assembly factor BamB